MVTKEYVDNLGLLKGDAIVIGLRRRNGLRPLRYYLSHDDCELRVCGEISDDLKVCNELGSYPLRGITLIRMFQEE